MTFTTGGSCNICTPVGCWAMCCLARRIYSDSDKCCLPEHPKSRHAATRDVAALFIAEDSFGEHSFDGKRKAGFSHGDAADTADEVGNFERFRSFFDRRTTAGRRNALGPSTGSIESGGTPLPFAFFRSDPCSPCRREKPFMGPIRDFLPWAPPMQGGRRRGFTRCRRAERAYDRPGRRRQGPWWRRRRR